MAEKSHEPDYVNDLPEGYPENTPRCQHEFEHDYEYEGRSVQHRPCGLLVEDYDGDPEPRCYFHCTRPRPRQGDEAVKGKLEGAIRALAFVGEAQLLGAPLQRAVLVRANLHSVDLFGANLQGANLWRANLPAAGLYDATLRDACFESANLRGAELTLANARGADFAMADLRAGELAEAKLQRATLVAAQLQGASLNSVKLDGASLYAARLQGAHLRRTQLVNADLRQVTIASLQEDTEKIGLAITRMADMREADLRGALLSGATIAPEADLSGATFGFIVARRWWPWQKRGCIGLRGIRRWWRLRNTRWNEYHIRDERCARSDQEWKKAKALHTRLKEDKPPTFQECETVYRQLRNNYQHRAQQQEASAFFIREMECRRAQMRRDLRGNGEEQYKGHGQGRSWLSKVLTFLFMSLAYHVAGYTEWPGRVLAWAAGIWGLSAGVLKWWGCANNQGMSWGDALYTSTANLTSLNSQGAKSLGAAFSANTCFKIVASVESVCGIVLAALFVACLVRKFSR